MRNTKPGQFNIGGGPSGTVIDRDSDPRAVREMRDACQRWLDEKADEDAATAAMVPDLMSRMLDR